MKKWYVKLGVIVAILVVIGVFAGYPADMIPGAWSDFSFLTDRMGEKMESIHAFLKGSKNRGRNELFLSDREMPDLVQSVDIRYDHNGIGDEELLRNCTEKERGGEL